MPAHEVIRPSTSPWASPVVLVRKKNGTLQCCVDYWALNTVTKPDVFTISCTDDLPNQPGQCTIFSTLDHAAGYWQIKVRTSGQPGEDCLHYPPGLYKFLVMPFGLRNVPTTFQWMMLVARSSELANTILYHLERRCSIPNRQSCQITSEQSFCSRCIVG